jgi:hypothetical protein
MVLVRRRRFGVSSFFLDQFGQPHEQEAGPVLALHIQFERWLGGRPLRAEAFIDPGADCTLLSHRWLETRWKEALPGAKLRRPVMSPRGYVRENVSMIIAGHRLDFPPSPQLAWQPAGGTQQADLREMSGYEDLLLGRDFLRHHGLLLVVDGGGEFSLLLPDDADNIRRRDAVRRAFE